MTTDGEPLIRLRLVPVEVFGTDEPCGNCGKDHEWGYGLMDAVQAWSDCNRAIGRIYRVDEAESERWRQPGDTVEIWVRQPDMPWFEKRFGEDSAPEDREGVVTCAECGHRGPLAPCCGRESHAGRLVCADVAGCRDRLLAEVRRDDPDYQQEWKP